MKMEFEDPTQQSAPDSCPYLGLKNDQATFSAYPSGWNACYRVKPAATPKLAYQRAYCLQQNHVNCPIYQGPAGQKMPKDLQTRSKGLTKTAKMIIRVGVITLLLILVALAVLFRDKLFGDLPGFLSSEQNETVSFTPTDDLLGLSASKTADALSMEIPNTPTATNPPPTPTVVTPTPTEVPRILDLETPIGDEVQFIIHRVTDNESLNAFADDYDTSVEAITAVNYRLLTPLWVDSIIVIPLNFTDVSNLPAFEAYEVMEIIQVEDLADNLSVSLQDLIGFNDIDPERTLRPGEWVLIPRARP